MDLVRVGVRDRLLKCFGGCLRSPEAREPLAQQQQIVRADPRAERGLSQLASIRVERLFVAFDTRKLHQVQRRCPAKHLGRWSRRKNKGSMTRRVADTQLSEHCSDVSKHKITSCRV